MSIFIIEILFPLFQQRQRSFFLRRCIFLRWAYLGKHLQEMLADLRRIIIIGGTDKTESIGHQDAALCLLLLVFLSFFIFLVCNLLH